MARSAEATREAKRLHMARRRAEDIEGARAYSRDYHHRNREKQTAKMREYAARRFFWNREMHLRGPDRATARQLWALWHKQRGCCALTGRRLGRDAHLDHIVPLARGGGHEISNLRFLCHQANLAKRALSDDEFISLCGDVIRWIGRRIALIESL